MATTFTSFGEQIRNHGISVHPDILKFVAPSSVTPDNWYAAVSRAGNLLRHDPDIELVDQVIPDCMIDGESLKKRTLLTILNSSLVRRTMVDPGTTYFCKKVRPLDTCSYAESSFSATLDAMQRPYDEPSPVEGLQFGWSIIENQGQAIAVTKNLGEKSTLSLVEFTINGIPFPAGSLLRAHPSNGDWKKRTDKHIIPSVAIGRAAFYRLTPYALHPEERRPEFNEVLDSAHCVPTEPLESWTLDHIGCVVQAALNAHS